MTQITQKSADGRRNARMGRRFAPAIGAVLIFGTSTLSAQTVRGTVVDSASAQPLESVSVQLVRADSQVVARDLTNKAGAFVLQAPAPGAYRLRLRRIGYQSFESPMVLNARGDLTLPLRLSAVPLQLAPVSVEATASVYLQDHGFYRRKESERGTFLDPAAVEKLATKAKLSTDILVRVPGVRIYQGAPQLRTCRTAGSTGSEDKYAPHIYIDGVRGGKEMMWSLQPNDILAVEVYMGPSQIPLQYGGTSTPCGVILIWTKH